MGSALLQEAVRLAKSAVYWRGEPYEIPGKTLRYLPGTRPVRLKYADSDNWVARYDALEIQALLAGLKPGQTTIDIGAHAGQYAILMAALAGERGTVVAFEPDPYARRMLERNIRLNPSIKAPTVEAVAVFDGSPQLLHSKAGNAQSSLTVTGVDYQGDGTAEAIPVPTVTLDGYLAAHALRPDWVKIDTEGAEVAILRGSPALLASDAQIMVELHPYAWEGFGVTFAELQDLVFASGRTMRYLDRQEPLTADPVYGVVLLEH